ncbi:uncharacterized protein ACBT44_021775 isoform 1-T1 [Syngnathus typhle]
MRGKVKWKARTPARQVQQGRSVAAADDRRRVPGHDWKLARDKSRQADRQGDRQVGKQATCVVEMAARAHAATSLCPAREVFCSFNECLSESFVCSSRRTEPWYKYSRQVLLDIGESEFCGVLDFEAGTLKELGLLRPETSPDSPAAIPPPVRERRKRCARRLKRGKRGDVRARLAANPARPAVPSILLANVRSLDNKMDYVRLLRSTNRTVRNCCVLVFTETWLTVNIPDSAVHLERLACYRAGRAIVKGGKSRGGGICVYIRDEWCRDSVVVCKHCSPLAEFVIIKCRPFYLSREFTAILLVAVYIPPSNIEGDRIAALSELYQAVSEEQTAHPDGFTIFAGDFNHANLKSVFPRLHQHVNFPTRGDSFLDLVYSSHKGAFKAAPLPHLGLSDHITVMLLPAYRQMVSASRLVCKRVWVWPEGASDALRDCFGTSDWDMFRRAATCDDRTDIEEYTDSVSSYITKCIDDVTHAKSIVTQATRKPWLTGAAEAQGQSLQSGG